VATRPKEKKPNVVFLFLSLALSPHRTGKQKLSGRDGQILTRFLRHCQMTSESNQQQQQQQQQRKVKRNK
jgi:hypothetical protein